MTTKEKFLAIQTYDEYDRRRGEFKGKHYSQFKKMKETQ